MGTVKPAVASGMRNNAVFNREKCRLSWNQCHQVQRMFFIGGWSQSVSGFRMGSQSYDPKQKLKHMNIACSVWQNEKNHKNLLNGRQRAKKMKQVEI